MRFGDLASPGLGSAAYHCTMQPTTTTPCPAALLLTRCTAVLTGPAAAGRDRGARIARAVLEDQKPPVTALQRLPAHRLRSWVGACIWASAEARRQPAERGCA